MPNTARGFRYPASSDSANVQQYFQNLASDTDTYTRFGVYASIAARNAAIPSPSAGLYCLVAGEPHFYDGTNWRFRLDGDASGSGATTTGDMTFAHGGGRAPTRWGITQAATGTPAVDYVLRVIKVSADSTNLTVRAINENTDSPMSGNPIVVTWWARF